MHSNIDIVLLNKHLRMKIIYTTLLLSIIMFVSSCGSQEKSIAKFYREANNQMKGESFLIEESKNTSGKETKSSSESINYTAESAYMAQVKATYEHYKVNHDDSEYANGDVYLEAAKRRQALIDQCPDCPKKTSVVVPITSPANSQSQGGQTSETSVGEPESSVFFAHLLDTDKKILKTEELSYLNKEDKAKLKKYSVVIASLTNKYNGSEHLKKTLGARESLIVVKNTSGIYYVIIGTYDSEQEALNKIKTVEEQYNARKSSAQLLKTYRIPLTDLWILRK